MNKLCFFYTSFCFLTKTIYLQNFSIYTADESSLNKSAIKVSDLFTGRFSVFFKSRKGKSVYRFFVNNPFMRLPTSAPGNLSANNRKNRSSYSGYFNRQFLGRKHIANTFFTCSFYEKNRVFRRVGNTFCAQIAFLLPNLSDKILNKTIPFNYKPKN